MARKCKCRYCGNSLTTDTAYKVKVNEKSNLYYCSKNEYDELLKEENSKKECIEYIKQITNDKFLSPIMKKKLVETREYYDYVVIKKCFKENENTIKWALTNKEFNSEFIRAKYIFSIILNSISKTHKKYLQEQKELEKLFNKQIIDEIDVEVLNFNRSETKVSSSSDISMFLD